jgi:enoyl-[acyl-carrier protein] reductase II
MKKETSKPLVNVPMLYPNIEEIIIVEEGENHFGRESKNVDSLFKRKYYRSTCGQQYPICIKSAKCGVDAIVAEGFEAGGHNGRMKRQLSP